MTIEIKQMQHFSRIAELGNLTRAASVLGLTQAALSRQVSQLEAELGVELFRRNGRGVVLTEAGRRLLEHVPTILRQVALAERAVRGPSGPVQGNFVLGLPPSLARTVVLPLIDAFGRTLPEVRLRTVDGLSAHLVDLVGLGKLDGAAVYNPVAHDAVELVPLADEELYVVSGSTLGGKPLGRSVSMADIASMPLIIAGVANAVHVALGSALAALDLTPTIAHEIENLTAILDLVRQGRGVSVIPASGLHSCIGDPELRLHRIRKPGLRCSLFIATPKGALGDALTERASAVLRETVPLKLRSFRHEIEAVIAQ